MYDMVIYIAVIVRRSEHEDPLTAEGQATARSP